MNVDVFVRPHDMLFVGPPWSATAGETHRVRSLFPPPPTSFQGAVRTHILRRGGFSFGDPQAIRQAVGSSDELPAGCSIMGPWIAELASETDERTGRRYAVTRPWFPVPRWCALSERQVRPLQPTSSGLSLKTDIEFSPLHPVPGAEPVRAGWVRAADLVTLLAGSPIPQTACHPLPAGVSVERRPGLAVTEARTAQRGMFYVDEGYRFPRDVGLAASVAWSGVDLTEAAFAQGSMTIGAKGRLASVEPRPRWDRASERLWKEPLQKAPAGDGTAAWIYLASPVYLGPSDGEAELGEPAQPVLPLPSGVSGIDVRIVTPVVGRPLTLGGFKMAERAPRPLRPFVPAGSGWYVELTGGDASSRRAVLESWHGRAVLGPQNERAMGCGVVLVASASQGDRP